MVGATGSCTQNLFQAVVIRSVRWHVAWAIATARLSNQNKNRQDNNLKANVRLQDSKNDHVFFGRSDWPTIG
jgi:hypothetical protein